MLRAYFSLILILVAYTSIAQRNIDVLHYRYEIEVNDVNDTIYGKAEVKFIANKDANNILLNLANGEVGKKGMRILSASFQKRSGLPPLIHHKETNIEITPMYGFRKGDTDIVVITYSGIPADGLIISKNKFGHRSFFSDNWPNRAHHWIPCVDDPADKASVEFIVTAPSHYQVISNGIQIEETNLHDNKKLTHWKEDVPLPTKVMVIGVADFAVNHTGFVDCIPVSSWVFPENRSEGFGDYAIAKDVLKWYINYIGPYAYQKLANVQSKTMFGGMENASAIFYYENSVNGKKNEEELVAHEIVHQWFGNSATEKSFAHLWLSEGFATYLTHVYLESKYGTDSLNKRMQKDRQEIIDFVKTEKRPVVDSTNDYMSLLNANSYQKGGWILHMLRREFGDTVFKKTVREYYATYGGKNAETKDLQRVFEKVSGKNLEQFFKQWLHTGENPKLNVEWNYDAKQKKISFTVTQLQQNLFTFPLEIRFGSNRSSGNKLLKLTVSKKNETFSFPAADNIVQIVADPLTSLLAEFSIQKK